MRKKEIYILIEHIFLNVLFFYMLSDNESNSAAQYDLINDFIETCGKWVNCNVIMAQNNEKFQLNIILKSNCLSNAFLYIYKAETSECLLMPATKMIKLLFTSTKILLTFNENDGKSILFMDDSLSNKDFELFISQFKICSSIFALSLEDSLMEIQQMNESFLNKYTIDNNMIDEKSFFNPSQFQTALFPVVFDKTACETWQARNRVVNSSYFTKPLNIHVGCLTWNVGSGHPDERVISELKDALSMNFDIFFITLQEIDMRLQSIINGKSSVSNEWTNAILSSLLKYPHYAFEREESIGGVYSGIILNRKSKIPISVRNSRRVRLGMGGMTANKSAIIFQVIVGENATISFIGCHLSAHQGNVEARNQELKQLLNRVKYDNDYVVLIGDLNYRINLSYGDCLDYIKRKDIPSLIENDQLKISRENDSEINKFKEGKIKFFPTYKFDKNSNVYDTSQKQRVPSYTDRVLTVTGEKRLSIGHAKQFIFETDIIQEFYPQAKGLIHQEWNSDNSAKPNFPEKPIYSSYKNRSIKFSDHRPVQADLQIKIPVLVTSKLEEFKEFELKKMNEMSELAKPSIKPRDLQLKVGVKKSMQITLQNASFSWIHWISEIDGNEVSISPTSGIIFPGQTITVSINGIKSTSKKSKLQIRGKEKYTRNIQIKTRDGLPLAFYEVMVTNKK